MRFYVLRRQLGKNRCVKIYKSVPALQNTLRTDLQNGKLATGPYRLGQKDWRANRPGIVLFRLLGNSFSAILN